MEWAEEREGYVSVLYEYLKGSQASAPKDSHLVSNQKKKMTSWIILRIDVMFLSQYHDGCESYSDFVRFLTFFLNVFNLMSE